MNMAGEIVLRIRLRFYNHALELLAIGLAFHQQVADELGGKLLARGG